MASPVIKVTAKQTKTSKVLFATLILLGKCRLLSLEKICNIVNRSLVNGAFKYKIENGKWKTLDIGRFEVERK